MQRPTPRDPTARSGPNRSLDPTALATSAATVSAGVMLLLGLFGRIGVYTGAVGMMEEWHLFFRPTLLGTVSGMVEGALVAFVLVWPVAWLYNVLARA